MKTDKKLNTILSILIIFNKSNTINNHIHILTIKVCDAYCIWLSLIKNIRYTIFTVDRKKKGIIILFKYKIKPKKTLELIHSLYIYIFFYKMSIYILSKWINIINNILKTKLAQQMNEFRAIELISKKDLALKKFSLQQCSHCYRAQNIFTL